MSFAKMGKFHYEKLKVAGIPLAEIDESGKLYTKKEGAY
jgi:hypothetical protein